MIPVSCTYTEVSCHALADVHLAETWGMWLPSTPPSQLLQSLLRALACWCDLGVRAFMMNLGWVRCRWGGDGGLTCTFAVVGMNQHLRGPHTECWAATCSVLFCSFLTPFMLESA
jgi:hypothetical protein